VNKIILLDDHAIHPFDGAIRQSGSHFPNKNMRVIFLQNIKGVAQIGDIKNVSDGYARNFLLPKKLAQAATGDTVKLAESLRSKREKQYETDKEGALELAKKLEGLAVDIKEDANDEGHLYGSVNEKKIAHALKERGINLKEEYISLPQHLKTLGEHEVEIELHPEVKAKISVIVLGNK